VLLNFLGTRSDVSYIMNPMFMMKASAFFSSINERSSD